MRLLRTLTVSVVAVSLVFVGCSDDDDDGSDVATDDTTPTTAPESDTTDQASRPTISVAENAELGEILVGPNGHTLYLFERDQGTTTACTGACATNWPALAAADPSVGEGVDEGKVQTVAGQVPNHVAYNGHLLYFFASDTAPGEAKGAAVPAWFPVDASGNKVDRG